MRKNKLPVALELEEAQNLLRRPIKCLNNILNLYS